MTRDRLIACGLCLALVSLLVGPFVSYRIDLHDFWIPWQLATAGGRPWNAYSLAGCNYPPVILYVLTVLEAVRDSLGIDPWGHANQLLIKLPNLAAMGVGAACLFRSFAGAFGEKRAAAMAAGWLLSINLFVNAAVWGQWDVILALWMLLALLALRRGAFAMIGFWTVLAVATKVQAIFILPVLGLAVLARLDLRLFLRAASGAAIACVLVFAPVAAGRRLGESLRVYTASVDTFPTRTMDAWNTWWVANGVELRVLHRTESDAVQSDARPVVPGIATSFTYKRLGVALFGGYTLCLCVAVVRRRSLAATWVGAPLCGVAMFMLATQMHERYIGPPAALMVLWLPFARVYRYHFAYWTVSAAANQFFAIEHHRYVPGFYTGGFYYLVGATFSVANLAMFAHLTTLFFGRRFAIDTGVEGLTVTPASPPAGSPAPPAARPGPSPAAS